MKIIYSLASVYGDASVAPSTEPLTVNVCDPEPFLFVIFTFMYLTGTIPDFSVLIITSVVPKIVLSGNEKKSLPLREP